MSDEKGILTVDEVAELLAVSTDIVYDLAQNNAFSLHSMGSDWRFQRSEVEEWLKSLPTPDEFGYALVVDDDENIANVTARRIERMGYQTRRVLNGEDALCEIEKNPPGMVLVDLIMPGMDGVGVIAELRKTHPHMPVIVMTGYPEGKLMADVLKYNPIKILTKPLSRAQLGGAMKLALMESLTFKSVTK
ncbi:MAG: response regulator [Deltaproteobacteria bacterium]|nr:response regulator [Deltaproteobacteria bacterium]